MIWMIYALLAQHFCRQDFHTFLYFLSCPQTAQKVTLSLKTFLWPLNKEWQGEQFLRCFRLKSRFCKPFSLLECFRMCGYGMFVNLIQLLLTLLPMFWVYQMTCCVSCIKKLNFDGLLSIDSFSTSAKTWVHWRLSLAQCGEWPPGGIWSNSTRKLSETEIFDLLQVPSFFFHIGCR